MGRPRFLLFPSNALKSQWAAEQKRRLVKAECAGLCGEIDIEEGENMSTNDWLRNARGEWFVIAQSALIG